MKKPIPFQFQFSRQILTKLFSHLHISIDKIYNNDPCWEWTGYVTRYGYGKINYFVSNGEFLTVPVHRLSYQLFVELIPSNLVIDHLCRNTKCFNPVHLEAVTQQVNALRGIGLTAFNAQKTHCLNGHPFTPENLIPFALKKGHRSCRICRNIRAKRYAHPAYVPTTSISPQLQTSASNIFPGMIERHSPLLSINIPFLERLFQKIQINPQSVYNDIPCWEWIAGRDGHGYGKLLYKHPLTNTFPKIHLAHRIMYEFFVGTIPPDYHIDHLCRVRHCVNPDHLEAVSPHVNWQRGFSTSAINARKTHCLKGHPLTVDNLVKQNRPGRMCKLCSQARNRITTHKWREKRRALGLSLHPERNRLIK